MTREQMSEAHEERLRDMHRDGAHEIGDYQGIGPDEAAACLAGAEALAALRAELESAAERDGARIAEVHEQQRLGQEVASLRAERDRLQLAFANHAIQCPQCQGIALGAVTSTTSPLPIRAGDVVYLAGFGLRHVSTPQAAEALTGNDGVDGIYHRVWRREGSWA